MKRQILKIKSKIKKKKKKKEASSEDNETVICIYKFNLQSPQK